MKKAFSYALILFASMAASPVAIAIFWNGFISFKFAAACHLLSSASLTLGFYFLTGSGDKIVKRNNIWWIYAMVLSCCMPVYGLIITLLIYEIQKLSKTEPPSIIKDDITVQSYEVFEKMSSRSRQLEILDRIDIEPFVDIFRRGQSDLKKSAVSLLGNIKSKKAISTLITALMDDDIEIRLFAAGVLGRIEDGFAMEIKNKSNAYSSSQENYDIGLDLVKIYISYAESGLLDSVAKSYYYGEALRVLNKLHHKAEILYLMAKSYLALDNYDDAMRYIDDCLKSSDDNPDYYQLYWNVLFSKRDYPALMRSLSAAREMKIHGINSDMIEYWT